RGGRARHGSPRAAPAAAPRQRGRARREGRRGAARARPARRGRLVGVGVQPQHRRALARASRHRLHARGGGGLALLHARPLDHRGGDRHGARRSARCGQPSAAARAPVSAARRLFLFDIDGTLVTAAGAGRIALGKALTDVYGTTGPIETYDFRGKTDPRIVWDLMRGAGFDEAAIRARMSACFDAYVAELDTLIGDGARVKIMPGIAEVVTALAGRDDAVVGLLTGNIEAGARVKL